MAITFQKKPLAFFNISEPAIFEFSTDENLGADVTDLVADLELKSLVTQRRYVIKNILPNYNTGIFRVDVSGYFKSLQLDNFDYEFNSPNKVHTVEKYQIGVSVHAEEESGIFADAYVFDSGYIFDETFIFAESSPNDTDANIFFPILGISHLSENRLVQYDQNKVPILAPEYIELAVGFSNTVSVLNLQTDPAFLEINGNNEVGIATIYGVSNAPISDETIETMQLPTLITSTLPEARKKVYGIKYKEDLCEKTLQFRFYNSFGGYSYFYVPKDEEKASRKKSDFINNNFYNAQDNKSNQKQSSLEYSQSFVLNGSKDLLLKQLFLEFLRSPMIEINLPKGFTQCKISGDYSSKKFTFDYSINVDVANNSQMGL